jgi:hypothetical protein
MENGGIFYDQLEYFTVIWYILRPFGTCWGHLQSIFFLHFCILYQENLATLVRT